MLILNHEMPDMATHRQQVAACMPHDQIGDAT
jgi:hypothetical protein